MKLGNNKRILLLNINKNNRNNINHKNLLLFTHKQYINKSLNNNNNNSVIIKEKKISNKNKNETEKIVNKSLSMKNIQSKIKISNNKFNKSSSKVIDPIISILNKKVYKKPDDFDKKIKKIKYKKNEFNLAHYQSNLIKICKKYFNKDSIFNLNKSFYNLRYKNYSSKKLEHSRKFIKKIEDKEEKIIKNIRKNEKKIKNLYKTFNIKISNKELPEIKTFRITKKY